MNEKKLARFYEDRRDDASLWAEKPSEANVRRGGTVVFSVRFSPDELTLLRETAQERGTTVSELVRRAAMRDAANVSSTDEVVVLNEPIRLDVPNWTAQLGRETSPPRDGELVPTIA